MPLAVVAFCALEGITSPLKVNLPSLGASAGAGAPMGGRGAPYDGGDGGAGSGSGAACMGAGDAFRVGSPSGAASVGLLSKKVRKLNVELSATSACAGRNDMVL